MSTVNRGGHHVPPLFAFPLCLILAVRSAPATPFPTLTPGALVPPRPLPAQTCAIDPLPATRRAIRCPGSDPRRPFRIIIAAAGSRQTAHLRHAPAGGAIELCWQRRNLPDGCDAARSYGLPQNRRLRAIGTNAGSGAYKRPGCRDLTRAGVRPPEVNISGCFDEDHDHNLLMLDILWHKFSQICIWSMVPNYRAWRCASSEDPPPAGGRHPL